MKYRNRGKHGFKRLKRQMQVYDYCNNKINNHETFQVQNIATDLGIARSTVIEILQELSEKDKNFIYKRGCIKINGVGNNGYGKLASDEEGLKVSKLSNRSLVRVQKKQKVYDYLVEKTKKDEPIPMLSTMATNFEDITLSYLSKILKELDKESKIIYRQGKVVAVNTPNIKTDGGKSIKYVKTEEPTYFEEDMPKAEPTFKEVKSVSKEDYNRAVKNLIASYILNADISTRDEIMSYVDSLMKITDKLSLELFKGE